MKVQPLEGEAMLRYHVESRSDPKTPHLVDLSRWNGYGQCSCKFWQCQVWPIVRDKTSPPLMKASTCPHIRAALFYLLQATVTLLIKDYGNDESNPSPQHPES